MIGTAGRHWFARLRRDGRLFAALAVLLLAIQALQPLAAAAAIRAGGEMVICTSMGIESQSADDAVKHDGCSSCIAGVCGHVLPAVELDRPVAYWRPSVAVATVLPLPNDTLPAREAAPPPGIRAPPFAV